MAKVKPGDPRSVAWYKHLFDCLVEGGTWGVPRCGLVFKKEKGKFVLIERMPYLPEMSEAFSMGADVPPTPSALLQYQQTDVDAITAHFRAAGIEVEDRTQTKER